MKLTLELQLGDFSGPAPENIPAESDFKRWAEATLQGRRDFVELVIRVVDSPESAQLNRTYRGKDRPTNVLSFPFQAPPPVTSDLLGDLVICAPVVRREALELSLDERSHWAHMVVHGVLHLLGFDHQDDQQAAEMEAVEIAVLSSLSIHNPYQAGD